MQKQIIFILLLIISFGILAYSLKRIFLFIRLTKPFKIEHIGRHIIEMFKVAFFQTKIFRRPVLGLMHAFVFWGFCIILFGSLELMIDGVSGYEKSLSFLGFIYNILIISGDVFAWLVLIAICVFFARRVFLHVKRFSGIEMKHKSHQDANFALSLIFVLMVTLIWMNILSYSMHPAEYKLLYPIGSLFGEFFVTLSPALLKTGFEINWWTHIIIIFVFMNVLPYSKHFHVFMSVPNVFLSRLEPLGKLPNMDNITKEIKIMMNPDTYVEADQNPPVERFGVKDAEDVTWKTYLDSLSCTECGRCTSVCPANITGKKLSPRKVMMDLRARMKEKGPSLLKDKLYDDKKSLLRDYITTEELWACTTCNACAKECPININHPILIMEMRRYLVMEESAAPSGLNTIFANIENNGAPWQFSPEDRLLWAKDIVRIRT
ncbi:MAG: 4Fe-4S dicluster domain-containing protein [Bacteroidetes bacterium]|nr:4Fe-4S dicluster domain-containing protein [Bacteroidota bacterium]